MFQTAAKHTHTSALAAIALAACSFSAAATPDATTGRVLMQVTPAQDFTPSDGRTIDVPAWRINADIAQRVIAATSTDLQPPVIDYEHQTLNKEKNGQPAPAAGWIHRLVWFEGRGLFAEVELTERARTAIVANEYRYFSPVFEYHPTTGEVLRIRMGALTNDPAVHGMDAINLLAAATARFISTPLENTVTLLAQLLASLGLPATTTEDAAIAACSAIKAQADAARTALQLDGNATAESVSAACTSLRTSSTAAPDPSKYVPIAVLTDLQTSVAALTAQQSKRDIDDLIAPALADGRLLPAQEVWARDLGTSNLTALSSYLQTAQPIAALTATQTGGKVPPGALVQGQGSHGLTAEEVKVAAACGMTPEQYAKGK